MRESSIASRSWHAAVVLLAMFCAGLFAYWHIVDEVPPRWDEGGYLVAAMGEYRAAQTGGLIGFLHAYITTMPGGANFLPLLALPGFFLFGPSLKAGISIFFVLWPTVVLGMFDFTRKVARHLFDLSEPLSSRAGFFAALAFSLYPETHFLANYFLTEFPLISCVVIVHAAALRYALDGRFRWALITGLALAFGLLTKTTFLAFLIAPAGFVLVRWITVRSPAEIGSCLAGAAIPPLLISAPFYVSNFSTIVDTVRRLTSAETASTFGLGGAWTLGPSMDFIVALGRGYQFVLCCSAAALAVISTVNSKKKLGWALLIFLGFLIPLAIVALSNFKQERYAYPGYIPLFALAGIGLSIVSRLPARFGWVVVALIMWPAVEKLQATYPILPWRALPQQALFISGDEAPPPDSRDWGLTELVASVDRYVPKGDVMILGGSPAFHQAVLQFIGALQGKNDKYFGFLYQLYPDGRAADMLAFIADRRPVAILYKAPPYNPPFLGKYVPEALHAIATDSRYRSVELPTIQPDGSRFILFAPNGKYN
jgi:4-amino-4-deoxy-L-arabinose transferase-like glycosyltransferase